MGNWYYGGVEIFWRVFIPLFVAIDVFGSLPVYLTMMEGVPVPRRRRIITQAAVTAFGISVVFLFAGKAIFRLLGITADDFRIGGGVVLLVLAVNDLLFSERARRHLGETVGVVPLGTPLIIGPAALTTILMLSDRFGGQWTLASLLCNLFVVWIAFRYASALARGFSTAGLKALSKVVALFLAAIAVMMIRLGVLGILHS